MKKLFTIFLIIVFAAIIGCGSDDHDNPVKTRDFQSPEEFMQNPSIQDALAGSDMITNMGSTPPTLVGDYNVTGTVVNSNLPQIVGQKISSDVCLHNQTSSGLIDYTETASGTTVTAFGNYITGADGSFTIWQEGDVQAYGCQQHNAIIISGTKLADGDLQVKTLTINLEKQNCEAYTVPEWFEANVYFSLEGVQNTTTHTVSVPVTKDTYINQYSLDSNYGNETLIMTTYAQNVRKDALLYAPISNYIPADAEIIKVEFVGHSTDPVWDFFVAPLESSWDENSVTWNTRPARGIGLPEYRASKNDTEYRIDVSWPFTSSTYASNAIKYGIALMTFENKISTDWNGIWLYSSEHNTSLYHPRFEVTYTVTY